jgi:hypothetical protein
VGTREEDNALIRKLRLWDPPVSLFPHRRSCQRYLILRAEHPEQAHCSLLPRKYKTPPPPHPLVSSFPPTTTAPLAPAKSHKLRGSAGRFDFNPVSPVHHQPPPLLPIIPSSPLNAPPPLSPPAHPFLTPQPKHTMPPQPFLQFWVLMATIVGFAIVIATAGVLYYHLVHRKRAARSRALAELRVDAGAVREGV